MKSKIKVLLIILVFWVSGFNSSSFAESNYKEMFNNGRLQSYSTLIKLLPKDSEIINESFLFYQEYKIITIILGLFILILLIFVFYLSINLSKRKQMEYEWSQ